MKKIKAVVFDMDGVIMDSMSMWNTLASDYLAAHGIDSGPIFNTDLQTMNLSQGAHFIKERFEIEKSEEEINEDITKQIKDFYLNRGVPKKGAASVLARLKNEGVRICMATATERPLAKAALKRNDILDYFEFIITNTDVGKGKDDPAIFEQALKRINENAHEGQANNIQKEETMIVEDSLVAIRTASSAGFVSCGVYDENEAVLFDDIRKNADVTVYELGELTKIIFGD